MSTVPSDKEQADTIFQLTRNSNLTDEEPAYLISKKWFTSWKISKGYSNSYPTGDEIGPIDNTNFAESDGTIKENMAEDYDYQIITKDVWEKLFGWYGGGPEVSVKVVNSNGMFYAAVPKKKIVLNYKEETKEAYISEYNTFQEVIDMARKMFNVPEDSENRLVDYYNKRFYAELKPNEFVNQHNIMEGQDILLDYKTEEGEWKCQQNTVTSTSYVNSYYSRSYDYTTPVIGPGKVGFQNLGNTCFFNSGTQCLIHQMPLIQKFLHTDWEADLNPTNPIGMKGKLAKAFGSLVSRYWNPTTGVISPSELKSTIGEFAPQFAGWGQQDSHELITFMLDGIHEDLNRCKQKPIVEPVTGDGTDDNEKAALAWNNHKLRNDSIIVDLFHGQLRSRLICPECHKVTTVFDPYMALSLPINKPQYAKFTVYFVPFSFTEERKTLTITIKRAATPSEVSAAVSQKIGRPIQCFFCACTSSYYNSSEKLTWCVPEVSPYYSTQYYVFEVPDTDHFYVPFKVQMPIKGYMGSVKYDDVAGPFLMRVDGEDPSTDECISSVKEALSPVFKQDPIEMTAKMNVIKDKIVFVKEEEEEEEDDNNPIPLVSVVKPKDYWGKETEYSASKIQPIFSDKVAVVQIKPSKEISIGQLLRHTDSLAKQDSEEEDENEQINLDYCFNLFKQDEKLDDDNQWFCPHCRQFVCADKKMDIWSAPKLLIIHLKRFIAGQYTTQKLETNVQFPDVLNMEPHVIGPHQDNLKYRLTAVSEHMGGLGGGHYTAHALVVQDGQWNGEWYSFNDSSCHPASSSSAHSQAAYVLFYERIDPQEETVENDNESSDPDSSESDC